MTHSLSTVFILMTVFTAGTASGKAKIEDMEDARSPEHRQGLLMRNLATYDITYPSITDSARAHLGFLTHDVTSRQRRKRAINVAQDHDFHYYKFRANDEDYHMQLKMNKQLFGPNFHVEHFYGDEKIARNEMQEHCYLIGKTLPQNHSVAVSDCDGLFGVVATDEDMIFIEPLLNMSYVDEDKLKDEGRPHLVYKHSALTANKHPRGQELTANKHFGAWPHHDLSDHMRDITRIAAANKKRLPQRDPKFSYVKFINRSGRIIRLSWVDKEKRSFFATLMPGTARVVNTFTSHRWVAVDDTTNTDLLVGNKYFYVPIKNTPRSRANVYIKLPRGKTLPKTSQEEIKKTIGTKYIESMVVADKSVVDFHGADRAGRYVMALMNIVSHVFKHKSLGLDINYVLVRIVLLHQDPQEITFNVKNPNKSLLTACDYMHKIRKGRTDMDTQNHDHATYLTRKPFGAAAGYAPVYGMCHPVRSCTLNGEDGFPSAFIIAHEVGHSLGMEHDGESNKCGSDTNRGSIMAPLVQSRMNRFYWSRCSQKEVTGSIRNFRCLDDNPGEGYKNDLPYLHEYPGFHYSTDDQCRFDFGDGFKFCRAFYRNPCSVLWCNMPAPYEKLCKSMRAPALDGTACGPHMWCLKSQCVQRNGTFTTPSPIHGGWGEWQEWEPCSKECGVGFQSRVRQCDNPRPRYRGDDCVGEKTERKLCNTEKCEHKMLLHGDEIKNQCALIGRHKDRFRTWHYYDESKVDLNCTFEHGLCSWINVGSTDQRDWQINQGPTKTKGTGPSVDHTTHTNLGKYLYFETSSPVRRQDKARLSSPDVAVQRGCLSFWYHMFGDHRMGTLTVLKVNKNGTNTLWSRDEDGGDEWTKASVDIQDGGTDVYRLVFEVERGNFYLSDIALDDISFTVGSCHTDNTYEEQGYSSNPCTVSCASVSSTQRIYPNNPVLDGFRCYDNGSLDVCVQGTCRNVGCDSMLGSEKEFDVCGVCGGDGTSCKKKVGKFTKTSRSDFTVLLHLPKGSSNVKVTKTRNPDFMLVLTLKDRKRSEEETTIINGDGQRSTPGIYFAANTQYVYDVSDGKETIQSLGRAHQHVYIKVKKAAETSEESTVTVHYEYFSTKKRRHKELVVSTETPPPLIPTTGQRSNESTDEPVANVTTIAPVTEYRHLVILDKWTKCSRSCGNGTSYLIFSCKIGNKIVSRTRCKDLEINIGKKFKYCNTHPCVKTYAWIRGPWSACSNTCSIGVKRRNVTCQEQPDNILMPESFCRRDKPIAVKTCRETQCLPEWKTEDWTECSTTCGVGSQTRRVLCINEVDQPTKGCNSSLKPESRKSCQSLPCPIETTDPLDCDFEQDFCQWTQVEGDDHHNWFRHRGKTKSDRTGPSSDHTLNNDKGHYMFFEASGHFDGHHHRAILHSPEVNAKRACLKFYYHMYGSQVGKLRVKLLTKTGYMKGFVWKRHGDQGNKWKEAQIDISLRLSYQISIEAILGNGWQGDIAVDDITFYKTECAKAPDIQLAGKKL